MRVLIVEDETRIAKYLEKLTREILSYQMSTVHVCQSLQAGLVCLEQHRIDLLLLDLNLRGEDGFEILKKLVARRFQTVIVSAYKDRAVEAFEHGVLDFVPKPFSRIRLEQAFERFRNNRARSEYPAKFVAVRLQNRVRLLKLEDVLYFQGARGYSEVHLRDGKTELHDKPLTELCKVLPPVFERIHKSFVVNMSEVRDILVSSGSKYELALKNGKQLPIGRTRYKEVRQRWL